MSIDGPAFYTKMQQLRDNRRQLCGLIARRCTNYVIIGAKYAGVRYMLN